MKDIYTPRSAAAELLVDRKSDESLQARAARFLGGCLPSQCFDVELVAYLPRYVPSATLEDEVFAEEARLAGLSPYWASYNDDKYTNRNSEKVRTIRPPLLLPKGQRTRQWIVEPGKRAGGMGNLETVYGYTSTDYQKGLRQTVFNRMGDAGLVDNTFDMSEWYRMQANRFGYEGGNLAPYYYPATMALAATQGVMFDDFDTELGTFGDLAQFRNDVVYPAIDQVTEALGVAPIIVKLPYYKELDATCLEFLDQDEVGLLRTVGSVALTNSLESESL